MAVCVHDDVVYVHIAVWDTVKDFLSEPLERRRRVLDSERHPEELEQAPGSVYAQLHLIFFFNRDKMKSSRHVNLAEHF